MPSLQLAFDVLARDRASKTLEDIGGKAEGLGSKLGGIGGTAKAALGGAAVGGVAALGAALVQGVKDAASYETLQRKTEAVIKSTGNAAGISVKGVQKLAGSLESISGVDEEEIINSQNVLATFKKISNAGPEDTFDKATEAALNMSVALGTDLQGATLQVGKALNDPIKGVTALSRAGVQFTQAQKDQIKTLVESGDTLGAQRVILGELESQFGGVAEAAGSGFTGAMARLQDALGDSLRTIGEALLPVLTDLAEWLADNLPGAIENFKAGLAIVSEFVKTEVLPVLQDIGAFITEKVIPAVSDMWAFIDANVLPVLETLATFFVDKVLPALGDVVTFIVDDVVPTLTSIITTAVDIGTKVGEVVGEVVGFFTGLAEDVAGIAETLWSPIAETFTGVVNGIIKAWNAIDFGISVKVPGWVPGIGGKGFEVKDVFPDIKELWTGTRNFAGGWAMVGERGPELAYLPRGADVFNAPQTRGMLGRGDVHLHMHGVDQHDPDALVRAAAWRLA